MKLCRYGAIGHEKPGIIRPKNSTMLDWECELAVVIGTKAQYVSEDDA